MNPIAAKLGEVGLPAPMTELAARDWDVVVVGGGHNGLTAAAYLARAGQSVLVLEARERLGGACTLERPFGERLHDQPVRVRRRPARQARDRRARPAGARLRVLRRRPEPVGAIRGRDVVRAVERRGEDQREPARARRLAEEHRGFWAYEEIFDEIRSKPAHRRAGRVDRRVPHAGGDRGAARRASR